MAKRLTDAYYKLKRVKVTQIYNSMIEEEAIISPY